MYFSPLTRNFLQPGIQHNARNSLFHFSTATPFYFRLHHGLRSKSSTALQMTRRTGAQDGRNFTSFMKAASVVGIGLGFSTLNRPPVHCDESTPKTKAPNPNYTPADRPPPPESFVSLYQLGFGTVAGICAGVFVKKGAKALAWFLGGIFVLLQYLGSTSVVRVDWGRANDKFANLFYTKDISGGMNPPTVLSLWNWFIDFLTADFQPRASFIAGFALGLRIG